MDEPFVPSESGPKKNALKFGGAAAFLFVLIVIIITFVAGGKSIGWIICASTMVTFTVTTGILIKWIMADELEEAKHTYLIGFQCVGLIVFAIGALVVIYAPDSAGQFIVSGCAGPVKGVGLSLEAEGQTVSVSAGSCAGFALPDKLAAGAANTIKIQSQSTESYCTINTGAGGTISEDMVGVNGVSVTCQDGFQIGGQVVVPPGVSDISLVNTANNGHVETLLIQGSGPFMFNTPVVTNTQYGVTAMAPEGTMCTVNPAQGVVNGVINTITVNCIKR